MLRCLPCPGPNHKIDARSMKAWQAAELLFYLAAQKYADARGMYLYEQFSYAGNLTTTWGSKWVVFGGANKLVEDVHTALVEAAMFRDPRLKPDLMMISWDGSLGEIAEVGTNYRKKKAQVDKNVHMYNDLMRRKKLSTRWQPSEFRPEWQRCRASMDIGNGLYICTEPTWRDQPKHSTGVLLYEVHRKSNRQKELEFVPLERRINQESKEKLIESAKNVHLINTDVDDQAARILLESPELNSELSLLKAMFGVAAVASAIVAIIMIATPFPDEWLLFAFAQSLALKAGM